MDTLYFHCAGLDVHKDTVVACVRHLTPAGRVTKQVRTFGTWTADLLALGDWLAGIHPPPLRVGDRNGAKQRLHRFSVSQ